MTTISLRIDDDLKEAACGYAALNGMTLSQVLIEALKEKLEDEEDYKLAMLAYKTLDQDNLEDFSKVCEECGIDYKAL